MITEEAIITEIRKLCDDAEMQINTGFRLKQDLSFSSLKIMLLILRIEEITGKEVQTEQFHDLMTIRDLLSIVNDGSICSEE